MTTEIKFNLLQQFKTAAYLAAFKARPGHKLVQCDLAAIEPRILAEFSRDPNLLKLYGPGAPVQDVYLFVGAHIALFRDEIRKYYDPDNPTPESIALAKKMCKRVRQICKTIVLAAGYGCSVNKLRTILITLGYPVTMAEAQVIHRDYWALYAGIRRFARELEAMWEQNGGYVINARGRPICVAKDYLHDTVNRWCQSSAHDCLQMLIFHIDRLRHERSVEMYPWVVDFYDEVIFEVPDASVAAAQQVIEDALVAVNDELGMGVQIEGEPEVHTNLGSIKDPDGYAEWLGAKSN